MTIEAWIVVGVLVLIVLALSLTRIAADALLAAAITLLLCVPVPNDAGWRLGVLTPADALGGFSNTGLATVGALFIVVCGLRETGGIDWIAGRLLGRPQGARSAIARILAPVCGMSAFLNNTPVVAMLIPAVSDLSRRINIAPSKLMIPLSYAAILGGTCSLIGTSTNLVVAGLVLEHTDLPALRMFDITWIGLPCAMAGTLFLVVFGPRLLPDRGGRRGPLGDPREYTLQMLVPPDGPVAGRSVEQAGLRNLPGCYLVEIERDGQITEAPGPDSMLRAGDRLLFAGVVESIRDLQRLRGLTPATDQVFKLESPRYRRRLFEAVLSPSSPATGRTVREGRFRNRYDGAIIAVARNGERVRGRIGDIELRAGDLLLIEADPSFSERQRDSRDFLLVSAVEDSAPRRHSRAPVAVLVLTAMVAAATAGLVDMLVAALLAAGLMIGTRCCTITEARRSVYWSVLIVIGAALGVGRALDQSGAAGAIAGSALQLAGSNPWVALLVVYTVTSILTEFITNNAAVALVFPIAIAAAESLGVSLMPFVIAIMMAGSASFATPLGYQTNLMVYGPGGYTFADFLRIGVPMNLLMGVTTVALTPLVFPF
jgi:di/tricarboxylate transporter